mgnify:CR=1 FL=1
MLRYLARHEKFVRHVIGAEGADYDWEGLREFHSKQIRRMQAERLVQLQLTLAFALFVLLTIGYSVRFPGAWSTGTALLTCLVMVPSAIRYFRLEIGIQRWYHLANEIEERTGRTAAFYETVGGEPWRAETAGASRSKNIESKSD